MEISNWIDCLDKAAPGTEREELMRSFLSRAWMQGYDTCYNDGGEELNPFKAAAE